MSVKLTFEGIRCFVTKQEAVLRPLTLLVGENSTGKSTFLALCRIASSFFGSPEHRFAFNDPPFLLGAYDQIASQGSGRGSGVKSFSLGLEIANDDRDPVWIRAFFVPKDGQPFPDALSIGPRRAAPKVAAKNGAPAESLMRTIREVQQALGTEQYAFAPIRTSPQRTYDPIAIDANPTGSHIPMLLAQLAGSSSKKEWETLQSELREFGVDSGLFDQIEVIRKGRKESDPFQIGVKSGGPTFNLVDVGYGVSQVLPILVEIARRSKEDAMFLMQQPEVHLHPRAQAQLGTFFARRAGPKQRFVVETHSDYLIDRVRMEVRRGKLLKPGDVSILYFERYARGARIHHLELDTEGNIINAPSGYRQFFLNEERSLLGI